jgi:hypothetical protein
MADNEKSSAWIQTFGVIAAALIAAVVAIWTQMPGRHPVGGVPVMGQLEPGINRQGMDFSANGIRAANAETCAEFCRTDKDCKAMTYVVSTSTCWLKAGVPPAFPPGGADYVSAVKQ